MKFEVNYTNQFNRKGAIYMYDTALILDGYMPKFYIPMIGVFYQLIYFRTSRTIPYSVILKHQNRTTYHILTYNGKKCTVEFRMLCTPGEIVTPDDTPLDIPSVLPSHVSSYISEETMKGYQKNLIELEAEKEKSKIFTARLEEYMAIAKSL